MTMINDHEMRYGMTKDPKTVLIEAMKPLEALAGKLSARPQAGWASIRMESAERTEILEAIGSLRGLMYDFGGAPEAGRAMSPPMGPSMGPSMSQAAIDAIAAFVEALTRELGRAPLAEEIAECAELAMSVRPRQVAEREAPAPTPAPAPVPMLLWCPECGERHVDVALATKVHHTHACQHCGHCWRPAIAATTGVQFLPGFKDGA